ncbi:MAG: TetR/AcrR family transcriptional regulator, partial [Armatimonadetes bacterium]|nr:TetR/AcrR family transcriptional regulator [Armatimonadota bacterium]
GIIQATLKVIAERGAIGTSMRDFAEEAGVTEAAIYRHFASRDDLLGHVFRHCADLLYEYLDHRRQAVTEDGQVGELAVAFFDFSRDHPQEYAFIAAVHQQQLCLRDPGAERLPKDLFVEAIQGLQDRRGGSLVPASLVAGGVIGMVMGVTLFYRSGRTLAAEEDCREYIRRTATCLAAAACLE